MAQKVKEMGFTADCGYNQLLYPVQAQTRVLLTWLVQRLPRSDDERAEDGMCLYVSQHASQSENHVFHLSLSLFPPLFSACVYVFVFVRLRIELSSLWLLCLTAFGLV